MKHLRLHILSIFCLLFGIAVSAQVDSLKSVVKSQSGYDAFLTYYEIGKHFYYEHEYDSSTHYHFISLQKLPKDSLRLKGKMLLTIAKTYHKKEDLDHSIAVYRKAISFYQKQYKDPEKEAEANKNLGREFYHLAQYDSAMVYYLRALDLYEGNEIISFDRGQLYHFIGSVFKRKDEDDKACEYYQKEIEFGKAYGLKDVEADGFYLSAICITGDTARLRHNLKALRLFEELGSGGSIANMQGNVALKYRELGMYDSALYYQKLNLDYTKKEGGLSDWAAEYNTYGAILLDLGRYSEAQEYLEKAEEFALASQKKRAVRLQSIYLHLYMLMKERSNYKDALSYQSLFYAYRDSVRDSEHEEALLELEVAYETDKKEAEISMLAKDNDLKQKETEMAQASAESEAFTKKLYAIGGIIFLILGIFAVLKWRESNKQKTVIEYQKMLVEEKNKDITDSMVYASSIQQAIITSEEYIRKMFSDFFVLYKPRDIVSGDFYWGFETETGEKLVAVGDCTGHGVPGAMMSMLGSAFLNEIVVEGKVTDPCEILNRLRDQIIKAMDRSGSRDGMDMAFVSIKGNQLKFAGANLPLYINRGGELIELKGNRMPVGKMPQMDPFVNQTFELEKEDQLYMFSDGFADQFGGPKGKKMKYKAFKDKLQEVWKQSLAEQRSVMNESFENWKGDMEQVDDVCVLAIKV